jgi:fatty acid-binding protein DegV
MIAICTDSSALFPAGVAERLGLAVVPVAVALDGQPLDEPDLSLDGFYARLGEGAKAVTSQPSPGDFLDAYAGLAASGAEEVLSIHLDSRVSGTTGSAELAARETPIPVTVVDTGTVSFGVGLCVRAAAAALAEGASAADAAAAVRSIAGTLKNVFVAEAGGSGRLPEAVLWSLLEFAGGKVEPGAVCDSLEEAIEAMAERVLEQDGPLEAAVGHAGASTEAAADVLARTLAESPQVVDVERYRVGAAVGAHTGPQSFGAFWWPSP